jgi:hypothetical protein
VDSEGLTQWAKDKGFEVVTSTDDHVEVIDLKGKTLRYWRLPDGAWAVKQPKTVQKEIQSPTLIGAMAMQDNNNIIQTQEGPIMAIREKEENKEAATEVVEPQGEATAEGATEAKAEAKPKTTKVALPEGYVTPVAFAKQLTEKTGEEVRPQIVYGYIKNTKNFPFVERAENPRFMVKVPEAFTFLEEKQAERAQKKEAKAAAEAAKAAAATETAEPAPAE